MKPYYRDNHRTLYNKSCLDMSEIPDNTVQCCVTSPPYWGLRKYAGEQDLIWGGDKDCVHEWVDNKISLLHENRNFHIGTQEDILSSGYKLAHTHKTSELKAGFCSLCGAWRGAYGLEPKPELYVEHTIEILREIRRVLRPDGVVFWNVGDSYFGGGFGHENITADEFAKKYPKQSLVFNYDMDDRLEVGKTKQGKHRVLKPKDLCLIPFRVAIAAQQDGWWVRSVIIWSKPNPMPESVKDRPTDAYEHILMLTKSARYYWDMEAVREPSKNPDDDLRRILQAKQKTQPKGSTADKSSSYLETWSIGEVSINLNGRNLRNVWTLPTQPYPEAHFATFPEALPERCIKAGSKEGDTVLDPFTGSGTTLKVAAELNRKAIGYEISEEYCELIIKRNRQQVLSCETY